MSEEKFNCPGCSSRTCARIDQQIVDGTFAPGPWVRCVECKRDTLLPLPRPPFNATLQVPDSAGNAGMRERVLLARRLCTMIGGGGAIACDGRSTRAMCDDLQRAAELLALPLDGRAGKYITVPIDPTEWMRAEGMRAHMTALYRGKKAVNEGMDDGLAAVDAIWPAMLRAYAPTAIRKLSPGEGS